MHQRLSPELDLFIQRMPKVELHLHLEGSITPRTLLEIARRNQVEIPAKDEAGVAQLFQYDDFHTFLTTYMVLARALIYGEDFEQLSYELGAHLADQNVRYAEVMLSPYQHYRRGINLDEAVEGAAAGFARVRRERGTRVNLAFDYGRQFGVDDAWQLLEVAIRHRHNSMVAWSIGGDEVNNPPEPFAEVYAAARQAGLHVMAHAGEVVGPASVWGAVDALGAERVGHGIRSVEDAALMTHLRERQITVDVCPSSNICTGAVPNLDAHPFRQLFDANIRVTLNTDDPTFFRTTLIDEYRLVVRQFGFTADDIVRLIQNAVHAAFLPDEEKQILLRQFEGEIAALRAELGV